MEACTISSATTVFFSFLFPSPLPPSSFSFPLPYASFPFLSFPPCFLPPLCLLLPFPFLSPPLCLLPFPPSSFPSPSHSASSPRFGAFFCSFSFASPSIPSLSRYFLPSLTPSPLLLSSFPFYSLLWFLLSFSPPALLSLVPIDKKLKLVGGFKK